MNRPHIWLALAPYTISILRHIARSDRRLRPTWGWQRKQSTACGARTCPLQSEALAGLCFLVLVWCMAGVRWFGRFTSSSRSFAWFLSESDECERVLPKAGRSLVAGRRPGCRGWLPCFLVRCAASRFGFGRSPPTHTHPCCMSRLLHCFAAVWGTMPAYSPPVMHTHRLASGCARCGGLRVRVSACCPGRACVVLPSGATGFHAAVRSRCRSGWDGMGWDGMGWDGIGRILHRAAFLVGVCFALVASHPYRRARVLALDAVVVVVVVAVVVARAYAIMAMMYAWLDKQSDFSKHLQHARQLVELMDNNPDSEEEVPLVGWVVVVGGPLVTSTPLSFSCSRAPRDAFRVPSNGC